MKKATILVLAFALLATALFAHGSDAHAILGTVKSVEGDQLTVTSRDGKVVTVSLTAETAFLRGSEPATRADLTPGTRVSVKMTHDNKTAVTVRMAPAGK